VEESEQHADAAAHGVSDERELSDAQRVGQPDHVLGKPFQREVPIFEHEHEHEQTVMKEATMKVGGERVQLA
jgi:hypothetical protein